MLLARETGVFPSEKFNKKPYATKQKFNFNEVKFGVIPAERILKYGISNVFVRYGKWFNVMGIDQKIGFIECVRNPPQHFNLPGNGSVNDVFLPKSHHGTECTSLHGQPSKWDKINNELAQTVDPLLFSNENSASGARGKTYLLCALFMFILEFYY